MRSVAARNVDVELVVVMRWEAGRAMIPKGGHDTKSLRAMIPNEMK